MTTPTNPIITQIWLNTSPYNGNASVGGGGAGGGDSSADTNAFYTVENALNQGVALYTESAGITILGAGRIRGGKTDYDVGQGFWFGNDDGYHKVAIGDPDGDTFNWDGLEINSKMNNLELRGWLRGPAEFVIDPAVHDDNTGQVIIKGNLDVAGGTISGPDTITIDPATVGDNSGLVVIAGNLQVDGTTTTINSTEMTVDDINIVIGDGAPNAAAADGGGITLDGANATIIYTASDDKWNLNKSLKVDGDIEATGQLKGQTLDIGDPAPKMTVAANGNIDTDGTLNVDGATTLNSTLDVDGATSLNDTLDVYGAAHFHSHVTVDGGTTLNGNIILGDQTADTIYINAEIAGHLIPDVDNTGDIGSSAKEWRNLYIDGTGYIDSIVGDDLNIGNGNFTVDSAGNVTAASIDIGTNFNVDADGNITANSIDTGEGGIDENGNITGVSLDLGATQGYILKQVNATGPLSEVDHVISELNDVSNTAPTNDQILQYKSASGEYEPVTFIPVMATTDLTDVSNTTATDDQILQYNSSTSKYEPVDLDISLLIDVNITDPADGHILVYQEPEDEWQNKTKTGAGFAAIAESGSWADLSNTPTTLAGYNIGLLSGTDIKTVNNNSLVGAGNVTIDAASLAIALNDLTDVGTSSSNILQDGEVLMWDTGVGTGQWTNQFVDFSDLGSTPTTLAGYGITDAYTQTEVNNLIPTAYTDADVDSHLNTNSAFTASFLMWNGSDYSWQSPSSYAPGALGNLSDVSSTVTSGASDEDLLVYNNTNGEWESVPFGNFSIRDLSDVSSTTPNSGDFLTYSTTANAWVPSAFVLSNFNLDNLGDVTNTSPSTGQVLRYNGTNYVNSQLSYNDLSNLPTIPAAYTDSDVDSHLKINSAATNQVLSWTGTDYGWVDADQVAGAVEELNDLTDVSITTLSDGIFLRYSSTNTQWETGTVAFSDIQSKPTTLAGYGITDAFSGSWNDLTDKPTFAEDLGDLGDVTTTGVTDGKILKYDGSATPPVWKPDGLTIGELDNVNSDVDAPTGTVLSLGGSPEVLAYDSGASEWVSTPLELDDLYGISAPAANSLTAGYALVTNSTTHPETYSWSEIGEYEEGTWTIQVADAGTGGNSASANYTTGEYTKIGRQVTISCPVQQITTTGLTSTNDIFIRNLPFSISNARVHTPTAAVNATVLTRQLEGLYALGIPGTSYIQVYANAFSSSGSNYYDTSVKVSDIASGNTNLRFTMVYFSDD